MLREAGFADEFNGWLYSHSVRFPFPLFPLPELHKTELLRNGYMVSYLTDKLLTLNRTP